MALVGGSLVLGHADCLASAGSIESLSACCDWAIMSSLDISGRLLLLPGCHITQDFITAQQGCWWPLGHSVGAAFNVHLKSNKSSNNLS